MNSTTQRTNPRSLRLSAVLTTFAALIAPTIFAASQTGAAPARAVTANVTANQDKPTVVLVHGAFADAAGWNGVIKRLTHRGYPTVAVANPLRGIKEDAAALEARLASIDGPIVLVGHSYGGAVLSNVRADIANIKALVYVAAFAPDKGEAAIELASKYPGSTLGNTLAPVPLPDGSNDLYIRPELFRQQFAADVPAPKAALMAATQRPIRDVALADKSGAPLWADVPSWFLLADADYNIPWKAQKYMADRAGSRHTVTVKGASHVVHVSRPGRVTELIVRATR